MRLFRCVAITLTTTLLLFTSGLTSASAVPTPFKIGALYWSMNIPGQVAMRKGLQEEAARINSAAKSRGERGVEDN